MLLVSTNSKFRYLEGTILSNGCSVLFKGGKDPLHPKYAGLCNASGARHGHVHDPLSGLFQKWRGALGNRRFGVPDVGIPQVGHAPASRTQGARDGPLGFDTTQGQGVLRVPGSVQQDTPHRGRRVLLARGREVSHRMGRRREVAASRSWMLDNSVMDADVVLNTSISGGEKSRLLMAATLYDFEKQMKANAKNVLVLDEFEAGIDRPMSLELLNNIQSIVGSRTLMFIGTSRRGPRWCDLSRSLQVGSRCTRKGPLSQIVQCRQRGRGSIPGQATIILRGLH